MNELLFGCDPQIAAWVVQRIPHISSFDPCRAIGVVNNGRLIAGVVYHAYDPRSANIQISMAADSPMWARRETIARLLHYPFRELGCWMAWAMTTTDHVGAMRMGLHVGFKRKTILPHVFGKHRHAAVFQMTEPEFSQKYEAALHARQKIGVP